MVSDFNERPVVGVELVEGNVYSSIDDSKEGTVTIHEQQWSLIDEWIQFCYIRNRGRHLLQ